MDLFKAASAPGQAAISARVRPQPVQVSASTLQMLMQGEGGASVMGYGWPCWVRRQSALPRVFMSCDSAFGPQRFGLEHHPLKGNYLSG